MVDARLRPLGKDELKKLIRVSRGEDAADVYFRGGTVINVYTRELWPVNVAVCGEYIAYAGESEKMVGPQTKVIDVGGRFLCPGYMEPHAHPFPLQVVFLLAQAALTRGTTSMVYDNLFVYQFLDLDGFKKLMQDTLQLPIKLFWSARLDSQTYSGDLRQKFLPERVEEFLQSPAVCQVGELTDWPSLLAGDGQMVENIINTKRLGKKVEGHAPGASEDTLNALAAAGVTACHESMDAADALRRLRLGYYATLRYSTLRPDLPQLIKGLLEAGVSMGRVMLTMDPITPPMPTGGFTDYLLRLVMQEGVSPLDAYPMATLNVATYYGLDDQMGGIAPGRIADILVLEELDNPTPSLVMAGGKVVAENLTAKVDLVRENWQRYGLKEISRSGKEISPDMFQIDSTGRPFPVMKLVNPVITKRRDKNIPERHGRLDIEDCPGVHFAALLDRDLRWVSSGLVSGFADNVDGIASSYTTAGGILVVGRNPEDMALAARRVFDLGGGVVLVEAGSPLLELPLSLGPHISARQCSRYMDKFPRLCRLMQERGHRHYELNYTLLFLSATHLPELRLSPEGLFEVKSRQVLIPSRKL